MRVTNTAFYRNFSSTLNDIHNKLNESMEQVETGRKYKYASDNPAAYYSGKKMDSEYQDIESKLSIIEDVKNRLYQQESGALSIEGEARNITKHAIYISSGSNSQNTTAVETVCSDIRQRQSAIVDTLNSTYENYFIYGGNDMSTVPFELSDKGRTLTYHHKFPGEKDATHINFTITSDETAESGYKLSISASKDKTNPDGSISNNPLSDAEAQKCVLRAMREQGRMSVGYGSIRNRNTLPDTYNCGLNVITGLDSQKMRLNDDNDAINNFQKAMLDSPIFTSAMICDVSDKLINENDNSIKTENISLFHDTLSNAIDKLQKSEHNISNTYREIGIKFNALEHTEKELNSKSDSLQKNYAEKLGIKPHEAIIKMQSYQYSYNAALKVGSSLMQSSLFDFIK